MLNCRMRSYWVYILKSRPRGTLYVGMTNDLVRRLYQHREGLADGFTEEHGVKMLVYYEQHATAIGAIQREKNIKHWSRKWKIDLICSINPDCAIFGTILSVDLHQCWSLSSAWTTGSSPVMTKCGVPKITSRKSFPDS